MSTPSLTEILAAYNENADYEEVKSPAKAAAFATACRRILAFRPSESDAESWRMMFDIAVIQQQLTEARQWIKNNPDPSQGVEPGVIYSDFFDWRGSH